MKMEANRESIEYIQCNVLQIESKTRVSIDIPIVEQVDPAVASMSTIWIRGPCEAVIGAKLMLIVMLCCKLLIFMLLTFH